MNFEDTYFNNVMSKEDFALYMRRFLHASILLNFNDKDKIYEKEIEAGYYWLNNFIEQLDPVLTKNKVVQNKCST